MPPFGPIKRKDLIASLKDFEFEGPYSSGKHQFMVKGDLTIRIPNPHRGEIGRELLLRILRQAGIDQDEWEKS